MGNPPQMQRFLADDCNPAYMVHQQADAKVPGTLTAAPNGVAPIPSALPHQQESPSYTHPSSTCSSALSPPMEDYYTLHSPPTPTDSSWSTMSGYYDNWSPHSQLYQHTGLAVEGCVKLLEVNPYQNSFYEDTPARPGLLVRDLSMSSDDSSSHEEQWNSDLNQLPRYMSPETLSPVKEEICVPGLSPVYRPIDAEEDISLEDEVDPPIKVEDQDDYPPDRKQKRTSPHGNRGSKVQKRPNNTHVITHAKRVKTELNENAGSITTAKATLKGSKRSFPCPECPDISFKDENGLQKHIKTQHTRPFICVFHFAGCKSTFASKNEWKRHCASQHLLLNYWLCQQDQCAKVSNASQPSNKSASSCQGTSYGDGVCTPTLPNGAIFNRKDLYTQHLRRMHVPPNVKKQVKQKKSVPEWEESVRSYQDQAHRIRCHLPTRMDCPAMGCPAEFEGPNAWDERMEHVAKHLDKAGVGLESPIVFGGESDSSLVEWAARPDVAIIRSGGQGGWELHNPLRPTGHPRKGVPLAEDDEDAEGEDFEE